MDVDMRTGSVMLGDVWTTVGETRARCGADAARKDVDMITESVIPNGHVGHVNMGAGWRTGSVMLGDVWTSVGETNAWLHAKTVREDVDNRMESVILGDAPIAFIGERSARRGADSARKDVREMESVTPEVVMASIGETTAR
jgi:hypothetical protein